MITCLFQELNSELKENCLNDFSNVNNLKGLNKEPIRFKKPNNPSCVDLLLTNRSRYVHNTSAKEAGVSDFHKLIITALKIFFKKQKSKIIQYRDCKAFNEELLRIIQDKQLGKIDLKNAELAELHNKFLSMLNKYVLVKDTYIRANNSFYMSKSLRKEIMLCSTLRNKLLKIESEESKKLNNKNETLRNSFT